MSAPPPRRSTTPVSLVLLFVLSGATGIVFEVLWIRIFTSILGSSTQSVGAVVTAFMLGIGLGQAVCGRLADRSTNLLRLYGWLELGVGLLSLLAFHLFLSLDTLYRAAHLVLPPGAVKWGVFAIAFAVVSVPAALIGGSLPVLVKRVLLDGAAAREGVGRLYGANTLGAAAGAGLAVALVQRLGYDTGYHVAVAGSVLTALLALALSRTDAPRVLVAVDPVPRQPRQPPDVADVVDGRLLALAFALSGFSALSYEIVWQRLLEISFQGTLTSFALILGGFLLGIGLGSLATRRLRGSAAQLVLLEALAMLLGLLGLPVVTRVAELQPGAPAQAAFLALVLASSFIFGAIFPLCGALYLSSRRAAAEAGRLGRHTGDITSANTRGAVLGSLLTSFVLIPLIGTRGTVVLSSLANLASAGLVLVGSAQRHRRPALALGAAAVVGLAGWASSDWVARYYEAWLAKPGYSLVAERESSLQAVLVMEDTAGRRLLLGGGFESGEIDEARRQTQRLQAHLPMLLHPAPRRVLEIGYGVGEIPRTVLLHRPERLDLVEIDPNMISMANQWFGALNNHASESKATRIHVMDGRQHLRVTDSLYDVILTDSMIPVSELSLRMYTLDHFQAGLQHLAPGGVMVLWLPLYIGADRVRVMLRTFLEVFPRSVLWLPQGFAANEAFIVGFRDQVALDVPGILARFEAVARADLAPFGWESPAPYLASFLGGPAELAELVRGVDRLHRDRAPVVDFIPTADEQGMAALLAQLYAVARQVALEGIPEDQPALAAEVRQSLEADRAFAAVTTKAELEAVYQRYPSHPGARLAVARLMCPDEPGQTAAALEACAHRALALSPWDVRANLILMRGALARDDRPAAERHARQAMVLQPYLKEALAVLPRGAEER